MIILFIITVFIIFCLDGLPLIKEGLLKEFYTFTFLIGFAIYLGISELLNISNPIVWLDRLLHPLGEIIFK